MLIEYNFAGIKVTNKDIQEGFFRPCFYIDINGIKDSAIGCFEQEDIAITIYYFCKSMEKGYLELLKAQNKIKKLLCGRIHIQDDFYIVPNEIDYDINRKDMTLQATFSVVTIQEEEKDDASELINELNIKIKRGV